MNQQDQRERFKTSMVEAGYVLSNYEGDPALWDSYTKCRWEGFQLADNAALEVIAAKDAEVVALRAKVLPVDVLKRAINECDCMEYIDTACRLEALLASQEGA